MNGWLGGCTAIQLQSLQPVRTTVPSFVQEGRKKFSMTKDQMRPGFVTLACILLVLPPINEPVVISLL